MENNENLPQFDKLSTGALRRYQAFFNIRGENENDVIKDKEVLLNKIKDHFNDLVIDESNVIETFIKIEKDQTNEKNNTIRKSIRLHEKSIAKFLDSLTQKEKEK